MMTFIYIITFICFYIAIGITIFGICYNYNFLDIRDEYIRDKCNNSENENIFLTLVFWPFLFFIILFICIPKRFIELLISDINRDLELDNKSHNKNKKNTNDINL